MTYSIESNLIDGLYNMVVTITNNDNVVLTGEINVCTDSEFAAITYVKDVFLPDLKRNNPVLLADLVLGETNDI